MYIYVRMETDCKQTKKAWKTDLSNEEGSDKVEYRCAERVSGGPYVVFWRTVADVLHREIRIAFDFYETCVFREDEIKASERYFVVIPYDFHELHMQMCDYEICCSSELVFYVRGFCERMCSSVWYVYSFPDNMATFLGVTALVLCQVYTVLLIFSVSSWWRHIADGGHTLVTILLLPDLREKVDEGYQTWDAAWSSDSRRGNS